MEIKNPKHTTGLNIQSLYRSITLIQLFKSFSIILCNIRHFDGHNALRGSVRTNFKVNMLFGNEKPSPRTTFNLTLMLCRTASSWYCSKEAKRAYTTEQLLILLFQTFKEEKDERQNKKNMSQGNNHIFLCTLFSSFQGSLLLKQHFRMHVTESVREGLNPLRERERSRPYFPFLLTRETIFFKRRSFVAISLFIIYFIILIHIWVTTIKNDKIQRSITVFLPVPTTKKNCSF